MRAVPIALTTVGAVLIAVPCMLSFSCSKHDGTIRNENQRDADPVHSSLQRLGPTEFRKILKAEFEEKSDEELLNSDSPSVVFAAQWKRVTDTSLKAGLPEFFDFARRELELDELPPWWMQTFRDGPRSLAENWYYDKKGRPIYHEHLGIDWAKKDYAISRVDGKVTVVADGKRLISLEHSWNPDGVAVLRSGNRYFLAIHDGFGSPYDLHLCEPEDVATIWSARVWANGGRDGGVTSQHHYVKLIENENKLYAFGIFYNVIYVEVFNAKTGVALIRFSTIYSDPRNS